MESGILKTGDVVTWRGAWGSDVPKLATVQAITLCEPEGSKYGTETLAIDWDMVEGRKVIVDLQPCQSGNGQERSAWAWGFQIGKPDPTDVLTTFQNGKAIHHEALTWCDSETDLTDCLLKVLDDKMLFEAIFSEE